MVVHINRRRKSPSKVSHNKALIWDTTDYSTFWFELTRV